MDKYFISWLMALIPLSAFATGLPSSAMAGLHYPFLLVMAFFVLVYLIVSFFLYRHYKKTDRKPALWLYIPLTTFVSTVVGCITGALLFYPLLYLVMILFDGLYSAGA